MTNIIKLAACSETQFNVLDDGRRIGSIEWNPTKNLWVGTLNMFPNSIHANEDVDEVFLDMTDVYTNLGCESDSALKMTPSNCASDDPESPQPSAKVYAFLARHEDDDPSDN